MTHEVDATLTVRLTELQASKMIVSPLGELVIKMPPICVVGMSILVSGVNKYTSTYSFLILFG